MLLCLGGVILYLVQQQSTKDVALEMFIDDETSQLFQMDLATIPLLTDLNSLESDEATKSLVLQMNQFIESEVSLRQLEGKVTFLFVAYQLQTVFVELNKGLEEDWIRENKFKKVSNGINLVSEFCASSFSKATVNLDLPTSYSSYNTWRCKLEISTISASTKPSMPTPIAFKYCTTGIPKPPKPTTKTLAFASFSWAFGPKSFKMVCLL